MLKSYEKTPPYPKCGHKMKKVMPCTSFILKGCGWANDGYDKGNQKGDKKMSIHHSGDQFEVVCKRCGARFWVIRNWGGGLRRRDNENINPAMCDCESLQLELF